MFFFNIEEMENLMNWLRVAKDYDEMKFYKNTWDEYCMVCRKKGHEPKDQILDKWFEDYEKDKIKLEKSLTE